MLGEQNPEPDVAQSCLYQSYQRLSRGDFEAVEAQVKSCSICDDKTNVVALYYCHKITSSSFIWMGKYAKAYQSLIETLKYKEELVRLGFDIQAFNGLTSYVKNLEFHKISEAHLSVNNKGELTLGKFAVDTGSIFDTRKKKCINAISTSKVNYLLNSHETFVVCDDDNFPYLNYPKDILGLIHLSLYERIIFKPEKSSGTARVLGNELKLYFDFDTIFFLSKTGYDDSEVNVCLDTGSSKSSVNFKFYRKHFNKLIELKTQAVQSSNSKGNYNIRGKMLDSFDISIGGRTHTFKKIPVFIDRTPWFHCDVIAGRDLILEHFKEISFEKKIIYIK